MKTKTHENEPLYMQLYKKPRNAITLGAYPYGAKLPSKRTLAQTYGMSVVTVEHTLSLLAEEGYIEPRERSGCIVSYSENAVFAHPEASITHAQHDAPPQTNRYDFPFSVLAGAMRRVIADYGETLLVKCPNNGAEELREAIARYLQRTRGISVKTEQIVIGAGAEYLYSIVMQTLGRDKTYAIEKPSYEKIEAVYNAGGIFPEMLELGRDGIKTSALNRSQADVLHITPFRSFPSGVTASAAKRQEYLRWAARPEHYIIEDDYESEFTLSSKPVETLFAQSTLNNVIYMNTFSKTLAPSIRVGYLVLPEPLLGFYKKNAGFYSCAVPAFEQYLIARLLMNGDFERHINRVRRNLRKTTDSEKQMNII